MQWVFGIPAAALLVAVLIGGLTGRLKARSCCAVADPRRDLRMAGAFDDVTPAVQAPRPGAAGRTTS